MNIQMSWLSTLTNLFAMLRRSGTTVRRRAIALTYCFEAAECQQLGLGGTMVSMFVFIVVFCGLWDVGCASVSSDLSLRVGSYLLILVHSLSLLM
jgi:hypothetical protein